MPSQVPSRHAWIRFGIFAISVLAASTLVEPTAATTPMWVAIGLHFLSLVVLASLPPRADNGPLRIGFLALDLTAMGAVAYLCLEHVIDPNALVLPFLAAFVVTCLVAVMGHRVAAGVLGVMAGTMVLGMGLLFLRREAPIPSAGILGPQLLWLVLAGIESTVISSWVHRRSSLRALREAVEREVRHRDAEASELVSLSESLSDSATLEELVESVLRHLRCHLDVRARAVALASEGECVSFWEEQGRLTPDLVEQRRAILQTALQRAGGTAAIRNLPHRAVGGQVLSARPDFQTIVDVPVRVAGRTAGVIYLADPRRGAVPPDRIGVLADVARRLGEALHRIERRRAGENRRMSTLLREMHEGVMLLGLDGALQLANPSARQVLTLCAEDGQPDQLGDTPLTDLGRTPPGIVRRFRFRVPEEDGSDREFSCTAVGVMEAGKRVGTLVTVTDITDEELARRQLMRAERTTLVGQTLAGVAHELNNPLAALVGYADLIRSQEVPEKLGRITSRMCEQAVRASKIVRNLLNFARKRNPQRTPTSVKDLAEAVAELFAYEARNHNVELVVTLPDDLPNVLVDRHAIQQILVNLTQNAIHALQDHDGERRVTITGSATEHEVLVQVRDTGPGVPDEHRARVFQAFFTTKGSKNGTGLGLALSTSIARDHGGALILEPYDGGGASFLLQLPRHAQPAENLADLDATELVMPQNMLVVDDEAGVRETLVAQLGNLGTRVESAANATEAERMLRDGAYDVILLDVHMPGTSGLNLHETLVARRPTMANRVIFMSGDFVNDTVQRAVARTGCLLLEKPFTMDELKTAIARARQQAGPASPPANFTQTS